jgi:hypothetical protein
MFRKVLLFAAVVCIGAADECPQNAHMEGEGCACDNGFGPSDDGQTCVVIDCPMNAHANPSEGPTCLCDDGFQPSNDGGSCVAVPCPANSAANPSADGPKCLCNVGYVPNADGACVPEAVQAAPAAAAENNPLVCPVNSSPSADQSGGASCTCDDDHVPSADGKGCELFQCPAHAHASDAGVESPCTCDVGFQPTEGGEGCVFALPPDSSDKGKVSLSRDPIKVLHFKRRVSLATDSGSVIGAMTAVDREWSSDWDMDKALTAAAIFVFIFGAMWWIARSALQEYELRGFRAHGDGGVMMDAVFGGRGRPDHKKLHNMAGQNGAGNANRGHKARPDGRGAGTSGMSNRHQAPWAHNFNRHRSSRRA